MINTKNINFTIVSDKLQVFLKGDSVLLIFVSVPFFRCGFPDTIDTYGLVSGLWTSVFAFGAFVGILNLKLNLFNLGFKKAGEFTSGRKEEVVSYNAKKLMFKSVSAT